MLYYEWKVGDEIYKLRLSTRNIIGLEQELKCNPLMIFGDGDRVPQMGELITVLYYSLLQFNHSIKKDDVYDIFDTWLEDGNSMTDILKVLIEVFKVSGIIKESQLEKN